jgi:hypothetical protein
VIELKNSKKELLMEIGSGTSIQTQIQVMKKAEDLQENTMSRLLNDSSQQLEEQRNITKAQESVSGASLTGLGVGLDITA